MYDHKDKYFGNGRSVRKIVEEAIRNQHLRMSDMEPIKRTSKMIKTILAKDINSIAYEDKSKPEVLPKLGFRISN